MSMRIDVRPDPVNQGGKVLLRIGEGPSPLENDFIWELVDYADPAALSVSADGIKAYVDTSGMPPNNIYEVRVTAQPKEGYSGEPVSAEAVFTVYPAPISRDYVEDVFHRATDLVERMGPSAEQRDFRPPVQASPAETTPPQEIGSERLSALGDRKNGGQPIPVRVTMERRFPEDRDSDNNLAIWQTIRNRTEAVRFRNFQDFIDDVLCEDLENTPRGIRVHRTQLINPYHGVDAYNLLLTATEAFLMTQAGVFVPDRNLDANVPGEESRVGSPVTFRDLSNRLREYLGGNGLPYLDRIVRALGNQPPPGSTREEDVRDLTAFPDCVYDPDTDTRNILVFDEGFRHPLMLELIWNYWHEESMLVQTINAITMRFQNRRGPANRDPLAHLELDSLRPLNNLLWGYLQEEYRRLTVQRRAYEYDHQYGLSLYGKAVPDMRTVDSRSKFLEAFHNLLTLCTTFYKQSDDTTVNPDPFPLLNALKEVHLILAQGAHNQFGDLTWTARVEMLTQQWLLARPEMNEYLRGRPMVPYQEDWMGRVDTMKSLQGWGDTPATNFHDLAIFGEQLLLSVRYTDWVGINLPSPAGVWALYWRPEIQGYLHAYRAATGVDLTADAAASVPSEIRYMRPSELLRRRLAESVNGNGKSNGKATPLLTSQPETPIRAPQSFRERKALRK